MAWVLHRLLNPWNAEQSMLNVPLPEGQRGQCKLVESLSGHRYVHEASQPQFQVHLEQITIMKNFSKIRYNTLETCLPKRKSSGQEYGRVTGQTQSLEYRTYGADGTIWNTNRVYPRQVESIRGIGLTSINSKFCYHDAFRERKLGTFFGLNFWRGNGKNDGVESVLTTSNN